MRAVLVIVALVVTAAEGILLAAGLKEHTGSANWAPVISWLGFMAVWLYATRTKGKK